MQELTLLSRAPALEYGLAGELDSQNADDFYAEVAGQFRISPAPLVFDCAMLEFIASTTLGTFVKLLKLAKEHGFTLTLRHLRPRLKKLFVICALDTIMEIEE